MRKNNNSIVIGEVSENGVGTPRAWLEGAGLHLAEGSKIGWGEASKAAIDDDLQKMFMYDSETAIGVRAYCQKAIRAEFSIDFTKFDKNSGGLIWDGKWGDFTPDRDGTKID